MKNIKKLNSRASLNAILDLWFGGTEGGNAVADILFGDKVPGGKLTTSFPFHLGQIPVYHSMLNTGRPNGPGEARKFRSNYLDIPNAPLYPFGCGLSYTNFEYGEMSLSDTIFTKNRSIDVRVKIKNVGSYSGSEIVQLYIRDVEGSLSRPMKELKGFQKVSLRPGEEREVKFEITEEMVQYYNIDLDKISEPGYFEIMIGPNSRDVEKRSVKLIMDDEG